MGLGLRSAWGHGRLDVSNLLGQLRFSNIHFSQRQFQVNSTNGRDLETSAIPSVQGQYGLTHSKENLPVLWQARFSPVAAPHLQLGLTAMDSDARWFLGYGHSIGQHRFWAQTVEAQNWSLAWETRLSDKWMVGAGVTGTRNQDPAFTRLLLRRVWSGAGP